MAIRISKVQSRDGKKYFFDVYHGKKRFRSKLYLTKQEAKKAEREWIKDRENGKSFRDFTFNEVIDKYIEFKKRNWKKSTEETTVDILNHIRYKLGNIKLSELDSERYEGFLSYLDNLTRVSKKNGRIVRTSYSARYKNRVLMYVKSVCDFADKHLNTSTKIPWMYENWKNSDPRQMSVLTVADFEKFISCVRLDQYVSFFTFLFYTGCRRGEALALTFDDIDFDNKTVSITRSYSKVENKPVSVKTKSSIRTLPLSSKAFNCCLAMKEKYGKGYVFGGKKPLGFSSIERQKDRAIKKAGLEYFRIHDFRHSFITMLVERGVDVATVSKYAGHASIKQTLDTYTHYYERKMKEVIDNL